uniref:Nudix hydrolase domain-containing protein n=1 Tax=Erythrolobus australicus TaxID=1077150 RepID=A0A7S1TL53_9RHOD
MLHKVKTLGGRTKSSKRSTSRSDASVGSASVLLVGSSVVHAQELTTVLKSLSNCKVATCEPASNVGKTLNSDSFDVVVFDADKDGDLAHTIRSAAGARKDAVFVVVYAEKAAALATERLKLSAPPTGANMVTFDPDDVFKAVKLICDRSQNGELSCPYCAASGFFEDDLWAHVPLFHINSRSDAKVACPVAGCESKTQLELAPPHRSRDNMHVHLRNEHGKPGAGEAPKEARAPTPVWPFALIVVRNRRGKFLLVQQFAARGYWLPGDRVNPAEDLKSAALRIVKEQAGIDIELTGVLRVSYTPQNDFARMRVIYVGRPTHDGEAQTLKTVPDYLSVGAVWVDVAELEGLKTHGDEPREWFPYVARGAYVAPLEIMTSESAPVMKL